MKPWITLPNGRLRPAAAYDRDGLLELLHRREVRRYLCDDAFLPIASVAAMLSRSDELDLEGLGLWIIEHRTERFAGLAGLQTFETDVTASPLVAGGIEPIIALNPDCWGLGLAAETLQALCRYAQRTLGLSRLVVSVDRPNNRSHRLVHRCGFVQIGAASGLADNLILYQLSFEQAAP
ncbi:MAG: GNAT family N-acetyltransferase [Pseudomonadota bacterium]